jgi:hypothetical protein
MTMSKLDLDSIYKDIGLFGTIGMKHRVVLYTKEANSAKNRPYVEKFTSKRSKGGMLGYGSISFKPTVNSIILETHDFENKDIGNLKNTVYLTYNDISDVKRICSEAISWFRDPEIKNDLFQYENNNPYKISDKYMQLHSIMYTNIGLKGSFLTIQPAVINDFKTKMGYPGVVLKCMTGVIGCCTISEFESLSSVLITNLQELYKISIELVNHYMLCELIGG